MATQKTRKAGAKKAKKPQRARSTKRNTATGARSRDLKRQEPDPRLLSRLSQLIARAMFELRLADDLARSIKLNLGATRHLRKARRDLSAFLDLFNAWREPSYRARQAADEED